MLIAITGRISSGKDSVSAVLEYYYGFEKMRLSGPLKKICRIMFDWGDDHIEGKLKERIDKRWGISPRQAMQCIGTDFSQHLLCDKYPKFKKITGRKIWSNLLKYKYSKDANKNIVVPDLRFLHECEVIRSLKGIIIKIERPGIKINNHESEKYIDLMPYDYLIKNDSKLIDLNPKTFDICKKIGLKILEEKEIK